MVAIKYGIERVIGMWFTVIFSIILFIVGVLSNIALVEFIADALDENQIEIQTSTLGWSSHLFLGVVLGAFPWVGWVFSHLGFSRLDDKRKRGVLTQMVIGGLVGALGGVLVRLVFYLKVLLQPPTVEELITKPIVSIDALALPWWALGGGVSGTIATLIILLVIHLMLVPPEEAIHSPEEGH